MPEQLTDDVLALRAAAGDQAAFGQLVERHGERIQRLLTRAIGDRDTALDLTQEALVRAWQHIPRYDPRDRFRGWLIRIAFNCLRGHLRGEKRHNRALLRNHAERELSRKDYEEPSRPDNLAAAREARRLLSALLAELPARLREPFLLKHLEEMSYEEMSTVLGVSAGALKVRVHRARKRLALRARRLGAVTSLGAAALSHESEGTR